MTNLPPREDLKACLLIFLISALIMNILIVVLIVKLT